MNVDVENCVCSLDRTASSIDTFHGRDGVFEYYNSIFTKLYDVLKVKEYLTPAAIHTTCATLFIVSKAP